MSLLLSGCGRQQESAKVAQRPYPFPEVTMSSPANEVARADSLVKANRLVQYHNPKYGFGLRYDSSQAMINTLSTDEEDFNFWRGSDCIAQVNVTNTGEFGDYSHVDSSGKVNLRETTLLPDTVYAAAMLFMMECCSGGDSDPELPPTNVSHDKNSHGTSFVKMCFNFAARWGEKPTDRHPAGPFYLVDVSSSTQRFFLQIMPDCSRVAPKDVEAFLDSLVNSIEVEHR
jgi:hypothetical protein